MDTGENFIANLENMERDKRKVSRLLITNGNTYEIQSPVLLIKWPLLPISKKK